MGVTMADRIAIETSTAMILCPGEKKFLSSWSSYTPGVVYLMDFSTEQPTSPGKLFQKHLSLVEDYKRKCVNHRRQPSGPCRKKAEPSLHPTGGGGAHCGIGR